MENTLKIVLFIFSYGSFTATLKITNNNNLGNTFSGHGVRKNLKKSDVITMLNYQFSNRKSFCMLFPYQVFKLSVL